MDTSNFKTIKKPSGNLMASKWKYNDGRVDDICIYIYETNNNYIFVLMERDEQHLHKPKTKGVFSISKKDSDFDFWKAARFILNNAKDMANISLAGLF